NYLSHLVRVLPLHSQSHHQQAIPSVDTDVFYGGRGATTLPPARGENRHKFNEYFHPLPASLTHTHTHTHTLTHTHTQDRQRYVVVCVCVCVCVCVSHLFPVSSVELVCEGADGVSQLQGV